MRIEKLDVRGFKSFSDKMEMVFEPGITAVVGPNGCGKSNVSDAISWILGEQSAKHLRGKVMEDVIFNGTVDRKPLGMAEANLTVSNENGDFGERFRSMSEIMITRRLYRSGESEYFINKIPCRLKDITEIFLDTGLGTKACSIIKQGEVNELLTSQPEQRRRLIEEAAGIEKYQMQKKEVERKLERTADNLERIEDIVIEVRKQVNSLKRQASKTKAYNKFKESLTSLESTILALEIKKIRDEKEPLEKELTAAEIEKTSVSTELSRTESAIEEIRLSALTEENLLKDERNNLYGVENDIRRLESRIEVIKSEISHLGDSKERSKRNISIFDAQKAEFETRFREITEELGSFASKIEDAQHKVRQKESELSRLKNEISEKIARMNKEKNKLQSMQTEVVSCRNSLEEGQQRIESIGNKITSLNNEKYEAEERKKNLDGNIRAIEESVEGIKQESDALQEKKRTKLSEIENLENDSQKENEKLLDIKEKLSLSRSEHSSFEKFCRNHEDLSEGPRNILSAKNKLSSQTSSIQGALSEVIEAKAGYEIAIESALKNYMDGILVDSTEAAEKSILHLKENNGGKCVFLPANLPGQSNDGSSGEFLSRKGVIGRASDLVSCQDSYRGVVEFILKDIMVVKDFQTALTVHRENGHRFTLVDLEGDMIIPEGILRGGSGADNEGGILLKKRKIKELAEEIDVLSKEEEESRLSLSAIREKIGSINDELGSLAVAENELRDKLINCDKSLAIKTEERNRMQEKIEEIKFDIEQIEYEKNEIVEKTENLQDKISSFSSDITDVESEIEKCRQDMGGTEEILEKTQSELTDCKVEHARFLEEEKRLRFQSENYDSSIKDLISRMENEKNAEEESSQLLIKKEAETEELKKQIEQLSGKMETLRKEVEIKTREIEEKNYRIAELDNRRKSIKSSFEEVSRRVSELDRKKTEFVTKHNDQIELFNNRFKTSLEDVIIASSEADIDSMKSEMEKTKSRLEKIGPVNFEALSEYETQNERLENLEKQKSDLVESSESLKKIIRKLNKTSRELFKETFDKINANFNHVFREFFDGGEGELRLQDENDLLESGIEVIARPPGKKLQNVNLLSGGEKAMTFISLLFAVFLVKPSPFCLLDEADAPLDEANVIRMGRFLKKMSENTQFLVITHANRTMEIADVLYGVTMEEIGVSKLISVKLKDMNEETVTDNNSGTEEPENEEYSSADEVA